MRAIDFSYLNGVAPRFSQPLENLKLISHGLDLLIKSIYLGLKYFTTLMELRPLTVQAISLSSRGTRKAL